MALLEGLIAVVAAIGLARLSLYWLKIGVFASPGA